MIMIGIYRTVHSRDCSMVISNLYWVKNPAIMHWAVTQVTWVNHGTGVRCHSQLIDKLCIYIVVIDFKFPHTFQLFKAKIKRTSNSNTCTDEQIMSTKGPFHIYCSIQFVPHASNGKDQPEIAIDCFKLKLLLLKCYILKTYKTL